jgi:hypothetical protein
MPYKSFLSNKKWRQLFNIKLKNGENAAMLSVCVRLAVRCVLQQRRQFCGEV